MPLARPPVGPAAAHPWHGRLRKWEVAFNRRRGSPSAAPPRVGNLSFGKAGFPANGRAMDVVSLSQAPPFITKDGSEIRELLAHRNSAIRHQSLAEARLPAGASTVEHYHVRTEEIYFLTHGRGRMRLGTEERDIEAGDAVAIPPGMRHKLWNTGTEPLRLLCCCAPAYEHSDTIMTE